METIKLHYYQKDLLKKLIVASEPLRFNQLLIAGLESEHMNYHLQKLLDIGFINKSDAGYSLSDQGKDYGNLMDDTVDIVEKQPKSSVLLVVARTREDGKDEYLVNKRLRHPYFGKIGLITGKIRFGETLVDASLRELYEESGLTATSVKLLSIFRKIRTREEETVQDVIFYRHLVTGISGNLIEETPYQRNFWATAEELKQHKDRYDTFELKPIADYQQQQDLTFNEDYGVADGF